MSVEVCLILIQNLILIITCSILLFCASKNPRKGGSKEKTGGKTLKGLGDKISGAVKTRGSPSGAKEVKKEVEAKEEEKAKPPPIKLMEGNPLIDENGYIADENLNEDLATLRYLEFYEPPVTGRYTDDEIKTMEAEAEANKNKEALVEATREMRKQWVEEDRRNMIEKYTREQKKEQLKKEKLEKNK